MSQPKRKESVKKVTTSTMTRRGVKSRSMGYDLLEPVEEKVIRMRYGLSEDDDKVLEYAVGASEETLARVTLMEASNISDMDGDVPTHGDISANQLRKIVE